MENTRFTSLLLLTLQLFGPGTPLRSPQNAVLQNHPPRMGRSLGSLPAETRLGDRDLQAVHMIHPVELRDLSAPRVLDLTATTLENHLVPSIADAGHRHQGFLHVRHLHVEHTLVALCGQHMNVLLTAIGHGPTIRRDVAQ